MSGSGQELSRKDASVNQEASELSVGSSKTMAPVLPAEECSFSYCFEVECRAVWVWVWVCGWVCAGVCVCEAVPSKVILCGAENAYE